MAKRTVHAIRPESVPRDTVGEPGLVLGGKYRLDRLVGRGGMASVWAATHETLHRPVAVKFVDGPTLSDPADRLHAFVREAQVAASVRHKNVVDILDFGVEDVGGSSEPYMVMELLDGEPLDLRIRTAPLDSAEAVEVVRQVLSGLEAVHAAGIVHRDVKPANVFVSSDGDGLFARVIDFGISKGAGEAHQRVVIGTPEYMSPEQAFGDPIDHRSDLYSVGVMLYELLAGCMPFEADEPARVLERVVGAAPRPLSELRPDLPHLAAVVENAMSRRAADRFASAREMQRALLAASGTPEVTGRFPVGAARTDEARTTLDASSVGPIAPARRRNDGRWLAPVVLVMALGAAAWLALAPSMSPTASPPPPSVVAATPVPAPSPPIVPAPSAPIVPAPSAPIVPAPSAPIVPAPIVAPAPLAPAARPLVSPRPPRRARSAPHEAHEAIGPDHIVRDLDF